MKAIKQYFPAVLFIMLNKLVLTFASADEIQKTSVITQMKASEHCFPVALFNRARWF